jgi:hypothetical protein
MILNHGETPLEERSLHPFLLLLYSFAQACTLAFDSSWVDFLTWPWASSLWNRLQELEFPDEFEWHALVQADYGSNPLPSLQEVLPVTVSPSTTCVHYTS